MNDDLLPIVPAVLTVAASLQPDEVGEVGAQPALPADERATAPWLRRVSVARLQQLTTRGTVALFDGCQPPAAAS